MVGGPEGQAVFRLGKVDGQVTAFPRTDGFRPPQFHDVSGLGLFPFGEAVPGSQLMDQDGQAGAVGIGAAPGPRAVRGFSGGQGLPGIAVQAVFSPPGVPEVQGQEQCAVNGGRAEGRARFSGLQPEAFLFIPGKCLDEVAQRLPRAGISSALSQFYPGFRHACLPCFFLYGRLGAAPRILFFIRGLPEGPEPGVARHKRRENGSKGFFFRFCMGSLRICFPGFAWYDGSGGRLRLRRRFRRVGGCGGEEQEEGRGGKVHGSNQ